MAKKDHELTVEERLKALYHLQKILSEVDRIKILRGELPLEVEDLDAAIEGLQTRINNYLDYENKVYYPCTGVVHRTCGDGTRLFRKVEILLWT